MNTIIINIGVGNIKSVANALNFLGVPFVLTDEKKDIEKCDHLILPGVGSFDGVIEAIENKKLVDPIKNHILKKKKPFLGICVGMQVLFEKSEEGEKKGLSIFSGCVKKLDFQSQSKDYKVPNVGYKKIFAYKPSGIFKKFEQTENFYFTHSYAVKEIENDKDFNIAHCEHNFKFIAGFSYKNIFAVQFHPEKSQSIGLKLISNFLEVKI